MFTYLIQSASSLPSDASALESSISALESEITALESSSVPWEYTLLWFTALVAIGVVMEIWVICDDRGEDMWKWKLGTIRVPERPSTTKFVIEMLSVLFITGGIVGELGIGVRISSINSQLRNKNAELRTKSDKLVGLLRVEAANLEKEAEAERGKRTELEKEMHPRTIDDPKKLGKELRRFAPSLKGRRVKISSQMFDVEAALLCSQMQDVFREAGIEPDITGAGGLMMAGIPAIGIKILGPPADEKFMQALAKGLSVHIGSPAAVDPNRRPSQIIVWVGAKPMPGKPEVYP